MRKNTHDFCKEHAPFLPYDCETSHTLYLNGVGMTPFKAYNLIFTIHNGRANVDSAIKIVSIDMDQCWQGPVDRQVFIHDKYPPWNWNRWLFNFQFYSSPLHIVQQHALFTKYTFLKTKFTRAKQVKLRTLYSAATTRWASFLRQVNIHLHLWMHSSRNDGAHFK